jgi:hypothetical protein
MTRISSLLVATTLAILPISAFAQQNAAPVKTTAPTTGLSSMAPSTTTPVTASVAGKTATATTANVTQPVKPALNTTDVKTTDAKSNDVKVPAHGAKTEVHGMNTVNTPHAKAAAPAKTADPAKS